MTNRNSASGVASFAAAPLPVAILPTAVSPTLAAQQAESAKPAMRGRTRKADTGELATLTLDGLTEPPAAEAWATPAESKITAEPMAVSTVEAPALAAGVGVSAAAPAVLEGPVLKSALAHLDPWLLQFVPAGHGTTEGSFMPETVAAFLVEIVRKAWAATHPRAVLADAGAFQLVRNAALRVSHPAWGGDRRASCGCRKP